jgi:LemA protein
MKRITLRSTIATILLICLVIIIMSGDHCDECFSAPVMAIKFLICSLVIIVGAIYFTLGYLKTESIIFDIESEPLRETDEATEGVPFVGSGIIESEEEKIINSPYMNMPCVYFHSIKEKYVKSGKSGKWVIVENLAQFVPFFLKDERGMLKIDLSDADSDFSGYKMPLLHEKNHYPKNSEIDCDVLLNKSFYSEKTGGFLGIASSQRYRRSEFVLRPGTKVFACGTVLDSGGELVLNENEKYPLIISKKTREQYVEEFYKGGSLVYFSHIFLAIGYIILVLSLNYFLKLNQDFLIPLLLIGNLVLLGSIIFSLYNRVVTLKERSSNALSNIEVDLKRRFDLIPNLVEVVKGYAKYEKELQQIIAEARAELVFSKEVINESAPVIRSLAATIENYPELKASEQFQSLMRTLVDTEDRIAYLREFYNRSVRKYNTIIKQFPFTMVSFILRIKEMNYISISRG